MEKSKIAFWTNFNHALYAKVREVKNLTCERECISIAERNVKLASIKSNILTKRVIS